MIVYLCRRFFLLCFVFIALSALAFSLAYLFPGEAVQNFSGVQHPTPQQLEQLTQRYRLDQGYLIQYLTYLQHIFSGDWGLSFSSEQPLLNEIRWLLPATLELTTYALFISVVLGVPLGILAAMKPGNLTGRLISGTALVGYSLPVFWWGLMLMMLFSFQLDWLPAGGRIDASYHITPVTGFILTDILLSASPDRMTALLSALQHMALPTFVLATFPTTVMIRFTRDAMLQVWEKNYIKTARATGLSKAQVLYRHALRNALLPVLRQAGVLFSTLITLAMLTEIIFSWPGIGRWLIVSIEQRNYPAIQAGLLIISTLVVTVNMLTEILHTLFNPLSRNQ